MTRPRLLDLFCGAGGAAVGYHRAGFDIVGVDIEPQPNYPFEFHQADATDFPLDGFDVIHASPPCQGYSAMRALPWLRDREYPMLLEPTWRRLSEHGVPWVIENVERAPMPHSTVLCGWSLGLPLYRHRRFGSSHMLMAPPHQRHPVVLQPGRRTLSKRYHPRGEVAGVFGDWPGRRGPRVIEGDRHRGLPLIVPVQGHTTGVTVALAAEAMGIDWMTRDELTQAIPPAYTEWIGEQLLAAIRSAGLTTVSAADSTKADGAPSP